MPPREHWLRSAVRASLLSVTYSGVVGVGALVAGFAAGSLSLIGFALNSVIDAMASLLLVHRFRAESAGDPRAERLEERAHRVISGLLILAGLYVGVRAVLALASGDHPESTAVGIVIAAASVLVLPGLASWKRRLSRLLPSRALRADSLLTAVAAVLAAVTLVSVVLENLWSIGQADPIAALVIAVVLMLEGVRGGFAPRRRRR